MVLIQHFREVTKIQFRRVIFDADVAYSDIKKSPSLPMNIRYYHNIKRQYNSLYLQLCKNRAFGKNNIHRQ